MKWTKNGQLIQDDDTGRLVVVIAEGANELESKIVEKAPQLLIAAMQFVRNIENTSHKPKQTYNRFKDIISEIPQYLIDEIELSGVLEQGE